MSFELLWGLGGIEWEFFFGKAVAGKRGWLGTGERNGITQGEKHGCADLLLRRGVRNCWGRLQLENRRGFLLGIIFQKFRVHGGGVLRKTGFEGEEVGSRTERNYGGTICRWEHIEYRASCT